MNDFLIERMIKKFMENNSYHAIIEAYEANNIKEVFALSHSFKGVTGNLALTKLFEIAATLTEATRNKESADIDKEIEILKKRIPSNRRGIQKIKLIKPSLKGWFYFTLF